MSENQLVIEELQVTRSFLLPSLAIAYSVAFLPLMLTGLLLIDIGETFGQPVGLVGQLNTVSSLVGAIVAVLMGVWSVRFSHKSLLLVGLIFFCVSAVGCSFSLNFTMLLITFSLTGFGFAMVIPMVFAIIGANLPLEKRTSAIGWISAISALSYIFGAPIIGFIAKFGGWEWAYIGFVLPITFLGLMMAAQWIPSKSKPRDNHSSSKEKYFEGFKMVFSNKSAIFCLVSYAFLVAGSQVQYFSSSFFREQFMISIEFAAYIMVGGALTYTLGTLITGQFVNRFGRKPLVVITAVISGITTIAYMNVPNLWMAATLWFICAGVFGIFGTTAYSLALEQVPRFRGTMMSLNSAAANLGAAVGTGIGGFVLILWDYESVGLTLGAMLIAIAFIYYLLVQDPTSEPKI